MWADVYMFDSEGLSVSNWELLASIGSVIRKFGMPFVMCGDWVPVG